MEKWKILLITIEPRGGTNDGTQATTHQHDKNTLRSNPDTNNSPSATHDAIDIFNTRTGDPSYAFGAEIISPMQLTSGWTEDERNGEPKMGWMGGAAQAAV